MLKTGVFTLGIFTDDTEIHIIMASLVAGNILDQDDRGVNVQFLAQSNVKRLMARSLYWGV